jgi:hypothetical protein
MSQKFTENQPPFYGLFTENQFIGGHVTYVDMMLILHRKIREFYQVMTTRAMIGVGLITHDRIHNSSPSRNSFFSSYNSAELLYDAIVT